MNPSLCRDEVQNKANPEGDSEEFMRRQPRKAARSKEHPDDGADGSHSKADRKGANHPLAVKRNFTPPDMPKRLAQREQKERGEECRRRRLIDAPNSWHRETHY